MIDSRRVSKLRLVQIHRLVEFEKVFSEYLSGGATADQVKERARKMLAVGLPDFADIKTRK